MARRRFFVPEVRRGVAELTGGDAEHLVRVLRAEVGQTYEISDNDQVYLAEITTARKSIVSFKVLEQLPMPKQAAKVYLFPALFKFDRFEWMLEKATELGVDVVQPFVATRSERGLAEASRKRVERWQRIAVEASQQSRRARLPEVHVPVRLKEIAANGASQLTAKFLLDEAESAQPILQVIEQSFPERTQGQSLGLILGPEGGWTGEETTQLDAGGWKGCSLGGYILRAETAAIAGLSVLNAAWRR
jgi:16S rRNA (uracil1498-N3)-methyltransferase